MQLLRQQILDLTGGFVGLLSVLAERYPQLQPHTPTSLLHQELRKLLWDRKMTG